MTRFRLAFALTTLAASLTLPAARAQELNAWDQRGAAPAPTYGEPKTRADVRAEWADARQAGWRTNSGEASWFPEPALVTRLAQRAEERVARRMQAERLAEAHQGQRERTIPVGLRQLRPAYTAPVVAPQPVETAVAVPSPTPATPSAIRRDAASIIMALPVSPEPMQLQTDLPPLMLRDDRLDFRTIDTIEAGAAPHARPQPPEAPPAAAESMPVSTRADQG